MMTYVIRMRIAGCGLRNIPSAECARKDRRSNSKQFFGRSNPRIRASTIIYNNYDNHISAHGNSGFRRARGAWDEEVYESIDSIDSINKGLVRSCSLGPRGSVASPNGAPAL